MSIMVKSWKNKMSLLAIDSYLTWRTLCELIDTFCSNLLDAFPESKQENS